MAFDVLYILKDVCGLGKPKSTTELHDVITCQATSGMARPHGAHLLATLLHTQLSQLPVVPFTSVQSPSLLI